MTDSCGVMVSELVTERWRGERLVGTYAMAESVTDLCQGGLCRTGPACGKPGQNQQLVPGVN